MLSGALSLQNGGYPMPAWYDITTLGKDRIHEKSAGLEESQTRVAGIIDSEISNGIPAHRIVLAGFSQGGAMSLYTGLNLDKTLGGVLCLSGYLVYPAGCRPTAASKQTPVLMLHGEDDGVVLPAYGKESAAKLKELGCPTCGLRCTLTCRTVHLLRSWRRLWASLKQSWRRSEGPGCRCSEKDE